jgi:hypothetical protein
MIPSLHRYTGVEASLDDLGGCAFERKETIDVLRANNLKLIAGLYTSWRDYEDWTDLHTKPIVQLQTLEVQYSVFRQEIALEDAIGSHARTLAASMCVIQW